MSSILLVSFTVGLGIVGGVQFRCNLMRIYRNWSTKVHFRHWGRRGGEGVWIVCDWCEEFWIELGSIFGFLFRVVKRRNHSLQFDWHQNINHRHRSSWSVNWISGWWIAVERRLNPRVNDALNYAQIWTRIVTSFSNEPSLRQLNDFEQSSFTLN